MKSKRTLNPCAQNRRFSCQNQGGVRGKGGTRSIGCTRCPGADFGRSAGLCLTSPPSQQGLSSYCATVNLRKRYISPNVLIFIFASQNALKQPLECKILGAVSVNCGASSGTSLSVCSLPPFYNALVAIPSPWRYRPTAIVAQVPCLAFNISPCQALILFSNITTAGRQNSPLKI